MELLPFIFIRHGETDWNRAGLFQGRSDIPLNETGKEQAREAARRLANLSVSKVMVSPLKRAMETATLAFPNSLGHVDKWRSQRRIDVMSMKPRKLSAVLS